MSDTFMSCNYKNCMTPLTRIAWITRCSHVFCEEHGERYFENNVTKIKCPACNETISRENDIIKSNLNPPDLLVSCVRPEKAVEYAAYACKLWSYQMQIKRKYNVEMLTQKYERLILEGTSQLQTENRDLKKYLSDIDARLRKVNEELARTKQKLRKYKAAYETMCSSKHKTFQRNRALLKSDQLFLRNRDNYSDEISWGKIPLDNSPLYESE
ncbi:E3 ubiquitin-protein ligase CCNB1IP1-like [Rhodnius prolixus]|uniref:E3 ubiquitin-protein ligase CCNB1IP1-like n=1 Tax=Rhodnius prolixus TaxID=13249 RepID=UPI003D189652